MYKQECGMCKKHKWCETPNDTCPQPVYKPGMSKPKKKWLPCEAEELEKCPLPQCGEDNRLAEAYVVWQKYERAFSPREALAKGTLFPELYKPCFECG